MKVIKKSVKPTKSRPTSRPMRALAGEKGDGDESETVVDECRQAVNAAPSAE